MFAELLMERPTIIEGRRSESLSKPATIIIKLMDKKMGKDFAE